MSFSCRLIVVSVYKDSETDLTFPNNGKKNFKISVGEFLEMQYLQGFWHEKKISNIFCDGCFGDEIGLGWMDGKLTYMMYMGCRMQKSE